jgi:acetylornithine/succinyldiaminopimelate/putrescine aminotransferase
VGRTGKLFGYQNFGVVPDIVTMAKPLANGIPIGAVILSKDVASHITPGDHGTTFGGSPFATRLGHAVFKIIAHPQFLDHVQKEGKYLKDGIQELKSPLVKEVRGLGFMVGMELKEGVSTQVFVDHCRERGVLVISAGSNTIRLVPPLIITRGEIDEALKVFEEVLSIMEKAK